MFQSLIGRLQTTLCEENETRCREFQSLIGRLQTLLADDGLIVASKFQSLIGRLQTLSIVAKSATDLSFNPS